MNDYTTLSTYILYTPPQDGGSETTPILLISSVKCVRGRGLVSASASWSLVET